MNTRTGALFRTLRTILGGVGTLTILHETWVPLGVPYAYRPPGVARRWRYGMRYVLPYRLSPNAQTVQPGLLGSSLALLTMLPLAFLFWFVVIWANRPLETTLAAGLSLLVIGASVFVPFSRAIRALALDRTRRQLTFVLLLPEARDRLMLRRLAHTAAPLFAAGGLSMAHTAAMHTLVMYGNAGALLVLYALLIVEAAQLQALSIGLGIWEGGRGFRALRDLLPVLLLAGIMLGRAVGGWLLAGDMHYRDGYQRAAVAIGPLVATGPGSVAALLTGALYLVALELVVRVAFRVAITRIGSE